MTFHTRADGPVVFAAYQRALTVLGPQHPDVLHLRSMVELKQGDPRRAEATVRQALRLLPKSAQLWQCLGWIASELGDSVESLAAYRRATLLDPSDFALWPSLVWALDNAERATPEMRRAVRERMDALHCRPLARAAAPHTNDPDPDRKIRIGYSSADFARHSAAFTFSLALCNHDRDRFEVYCYDSTEAPSDAMTGIMQASVDHWRFVFGLDDDALAAQIRADRIDILVDLSGVTSGGRLLAMARRPAPVQITAWGYATGLGLSYIDYLMSDRVVIPPEHQDRHREQILYLPSLMGANIEAAGDGLPDILPCPHDRPPTFGYFGRAMKLTDQMLSVWAQILLAVPTSRLILKMSDCKDAQRTDRIMDVFVGLGVDGRRVEFRGETSREAHLAQHNDIDVALDTSPVGGGTTTLDACMMGVPTVTLLGETVPGRISASILTAIGYPGLIEESAFAYLVKARDLVTHPLNRQMLRDGFLASIMCDKRAFAASVEEQYRIAWQSWCASRHEAVAV